MNAYDSLIIIRADGPTVSVIAQMPADAIVDRGEIAVWATTILPENTHGRSLRRRGRHPPDRDRGRVDTWPVGRRQDRGRSPSAGGRAPVLRADLHARRRAARARRGNSGRRAAEPARAGKLRPAHQAAQPWRVRASRRRRDRQRRTARHRHLPAAVRPQRIQDGQRHLRSPRRRRDAARGRFAVAQGRAR